MNWTKEQALEAFRLNDGNDYDPNWDETICDLLLGKVEMSVVVEILEIVHAYGLHQYDVGVGDN